MDNGKVLRVVDWLLNFENNRSRELKKLDWVPVPNKHDGDGLTMLLEHENGAAHFGAWNMIIQVASKCDPRGTLVRHGGKIHDSASLSRMTRIPREIFDEVIPRLVDDEIGWLEYVSLSDVVTFPHEDAGPTHDDAEISQETAQKGREGKGRERREGKGSFSVPSSPEFENTVAEIVGHLNDKLSTRYRTSTQETRTLIAALLDEGFKVADFVRVIDRKVKAWKDSEKMAAYLRPRTLFKADNFETYVNEVGASKEKVARQCPECSRKPDSYRKTCATCKGSGKVFE